MVMVEARVVFPELYLFRATHRMLHLGFSKDSHPRVARLYRVSIAYSILACDNQPDITPTYLDLQQFD
jgi:hypothetical protein